MVTDSLARGAVIALLESSFRMIILLDKPAVPPTNESVIISENRYTSRHFPIPSIRSIKVLQVESHLMHNLTKHASEAIILANGGF